MRKEGIKTEQIGSTCNEKYHDVAELFRIYRRVNWQMQAKILQVKRRFKREYGTSIDEFLESVYAAGMDLNDDDANIRLKMEAIRSSGNFLKMIDDSVEVMRQYHPKGEKYYWVLYYTYLSPHQPENVEEILDRLEEKFPVLGRLNRATYFRWKNDAFREAQSVLWGYEEEEQELLWHFGESRKAGEGKEPFISAGESSTGG